MSKVNDEYNVSNLVLDLVGYSLTMSNLTLFLQVLLLTWKKSFSCNTFFSGRCC